MRNVPNVRADRCLFGLALGFAIVMHGCDSGSGPQVVVPPTPPAEKAKDSMDFYKSQMKGANKSANK